MGLLLLKTFVGFVPVYNSQRTALWQRPFSTSSFFCSSDSDNTVTAEQVEQEEEYHNIIKNTERSKGQEKLLPSHVNGQNIPAKK